MRVAKFCENNLQSAGTDEVIQILQREHRDEVEVRIVDCFRRCLACRVKPFCRIQLTTIEADDAAALVEQIRLFVREEGRS